MIHFQGTPNQIYPKVISTILGMGQEVTVRGTSTLELHPVVLEITQPWECVVSSYGRPINLAFAMAEVLHIFQGRRDVSMLEFYNSKIVEFSDNGETFNAPYGYRLRKAHGYDQILDVIATLRDDPGSRQATLSIWHPRDSGWFHIVDNPDDQVELYRRATKDRACNYSAHLMIRDGALDWLHNVRSNDAILGLPYNFIQFGHLQAYIAAELGIMSGKMFYVADSLHLYEDTYYEISKAEGITPFDIYNWFEHPDFMLSVDVGDQASVNEESIRAHDSRLTLDPPPKANGCHYPEDGYWAGVEPLWTSYAAYKRCDDRLAAEELRKAHYVYAAVQARFLWHRRWHKLPQPARDFIYYELRDQHPQEVLDWITAV